MNAVRPVARNLKIAVKIAKTGGVLCLYKLSLSLVIMIVAQRLGKVG
ncbi:MAG: hypothetical protein LASZOEIN_000623 [Candidatus Fervidibacter sp.]|jgi:hypothetical protein